MGKFLHKTVEIRLRVERWWISKRFDEIGDKVTFSQGNTDMGMLIQQRAHQLGPTARHPNNKHWTQKCVLYDHVLYSSTNNCKFDFQAT